MDTELTNYISIIRDYIKNSYQGMFREPGGALKYPFLTPGSESYADVLWDWDSWLSDIALRQIFAEVDDSEASDKAMEYERGCILNFLDWGDADGWMPILIGRDTKLEDIRPAEIYKHNMHKPCLAQHAAFLTGLQDGDAEWLREKFSYLAAYINNYSNHHRHSNGLYFWQEDGMIGVDNDPCTFYRPARSSGSIYLNCLMYKELLAIVYLCECLNLNEVAMQYAKDAENLKQAVLDNCWDEWTGFFYSVDFNLLPVDETHYLHKNMPRLWDCLIQRIGVWSGFLALWSGIATQEQAQRVVAEHYRNEKTFNAPFGIRTLSRLEKMYNLRPSGNPSSWLGPIWGISNYMTFRGLVNYGFTDDAKELAEKTIRLFGRDIQRFGAMHEYYQPENGEPVLNRGFQNWNMLVLNMIVWLEGKEPVAEF